MPAPNGQPNQVSTFRLKASYWYVSHKLQLERGLIIFLIAASVGLYGYSIFRAVMILFVDDADYRQSLAYLTANTTDYTAYNQSHGPQQLIITGFDVISNNDNRYDFVGKIKNPNPNFVASQVSLQLLSGGGVVAEKTDFIYPNQEKYVGFFGVKGASAADAVLKIDSVGWNRYNFFDQYAAPRLNFEVTDINFKSAADSGIHGQLPVSVLTFKITNKTAYSYWSVGVYMVLMSANKIGGANYLALDNFMSGETRNVEMRWYDPLPPIGSVEVMPDVNILDPAAYRPIN